MVGFNEQNIEASIIIVSTIKNEQTNIILWQLES